jgi:hypothetical protein
MSGMDQKKSYEAPTKGLNDRYSPIMIDKEEAAELQNFVVNDRGILDKVEGYQKDGSPFPNSTDSFIRMLVNYRRGTTVDKLIMAAQDNGNTNSTYKVDYKATSGDGSYAYIGHTAGTNASFTSGNTAVVGVGTSWLSHLKAGDKIKATSHADSAYTEIASVTNDTNLVLVGGGYLGATAATTAYTARIIADKSAVPRSIVFNNKCIISNGVDKMMTYDNTTVNLLTDTDCPRAKFLEAHKSRVFASSTTANPSRVFWSATNDETSWDAAANEDVYPNDNGNIVAIKSFNDSLIVLKNNGNIYQLVGDFDDSDVGTVQFIRKIDTPENIGAIAERAVVVHTDGLYFLTETGIYRLDPRLYIQKVSYEIDTFQDSISLTLGPTQSKSYPFDGQSQWNSGTMDGLFADSGGTLRNFNDTYSITDYDQGTSSTNCKALACTIDVNNIVHVVYLKTGTSRKGIRYAKITTDGTITYQDVYTESNEVRNLAIASNAAGTELSVIWCAGTVVRLIKCISSVWQSHAGVAGAYTPLATITAPEAVDFQYQGTDLYGVCKDIGDLFWLKFESGVSTFYKIASEAAATCLNLAYNHNGGQPRMTVNSGFTFYCYYYTASAGGWPHFNSYPATSCSGLEIVGGKAYSVLVNSSSGLLIKHNWDDGTNTTLDASAHSAPDYQTHGYIRYASKDYWYTERTSSGSNNEKYGFDASSITTSGVAKPSIFVTTANQNAFQHNGNVFASIIQGTNTDELIVRRLSFTGTWTSPVESDATLTSWGTYEVGSPVSSGNTLAYTIALSTTASLPAQSAILNGAVISTDATKVYAQTVLTVTLTALNQVSTLDSLTLNYTGSGVDSKQAVGISYANDLYLAVAKTSDTANAWLLFRDIDSKWALFTHPVSAMCRYKNKLYAGKSTNGDLIILRQTQKFDTAAYTASFISKEDFLESIDLDKDIYKIYVLYEVKPAGSFTFDYRIDNYKDAAGAAWNSTTVNQTSLGVAEIDVKQKARTIQVRVQNANSDEECSVIGYVIVFGYLHQR